MTIPVLEIQNICAGYGEKPAIEYVSLSVLRGETYGLIGLNGAGKTTLIKTILGLRTQMSGAIAVNGHASATIAAKKDIAFLPERFDPAWFLSAYEFIDFSLSLYRATVGREDVDAMAVRLGLPLDALARRAQTYSKGMRQKLGLMTVFLTPCPLLVLDEPMSGLDPLARAQVKDIMKDAKGQGRTIFLSSHILSDMEELCDRVSILHDRKIIFTGTPRDLLSQTGQAGLERAFLRCAGLEKNAA